MPEEVLDCVLGVGVLLTAGHLDLTVLGDLEIDELSTDIHDHGKGVPEVASTTALGALEDGTPDVLEILEGDDGAVLEVLVGILDGNLLTASTLLGLDNIVGDGKILEEILDIASHICSNNNRLGRNLDILKVGTISLHSGYIYLLKGRVALNHFY